MKAILSRVLVIAMLLMMMSTALTYTVNAQKSTVMYQFTFENGGDTILKKSGAAVGEIVEYGAAGNHALKYELNADTHTGAGVHPYIWPQGIGGILAAQGDLKWGDTIVLQMDIATDAEGGFVYPFLLLNGENENYFSSNPKNPKLGSSLQTFTWELKYYESGVVPLKGLDNGGIALVDELSIEDGFNMYIDNVTLIKNGEWKDMDSDAKVSYFDGTPAEGGLVTTGEDDPVVPVEYPDPEPIVEAAPDEFGDHIVFQFDFNEEDAGTIFRKAGMTPGVIDTEFHTGKSGASLALPIAPNMTTGRGGVLPYIWPAGLSGVIAKQGMLEEGEYYELRVDVAWDGRPVSAKKGQYIYPMMLINGTSECYMKGMNSGMGLEPGFQTFVYRLYPEDFVEPAPGSDSGGIGFCSENSLACGYTLHFDNVTLIKHGNWKECDTDGIHYVNRAVAPTTYEETDENGVTQSGRQTTLLYSNDFEDANPESIFGHYNETIQSYLLTKIVSGVHDNYDYLPDNETTVDCYYMPGGTVPTNLWKDEGGAYPAIWMYNDSLKQVFKNETPLDDGDYYVLQLDMYCQNSYTYMEIMVGDKEYSPTYQWTSENMSEDISPFGAGFVTRYYVFKIKGMDLSAGNAAIAFFTDGYVKAYAPVYVDNFKFYSVRAEQPDVKPVVGDPDGDGEVTMKDVLLIREAIAGMLPEGVEIDESMLDLDGDGQVTMKDVLLARKYIAHMIDEFPGGVAPAAPTSEEPTEV